MATLAKIKDFTKKTFNKQAAAEAVPSIIWLTLFYAVLQMVPAIVGGYNLDPAYATAAMLVIGGVVLFAGKMLLSSEDFAKLVAAVFGMIPGQKATLKNDDRGEVPLVVYFAGVIVVIAIVAVWLLHIDVIALAFALFIAVGAFIGHLLKQAPKPTPGPEPDPTCPSFFRWDSVKKKCVHATMPPGTEMDTIGNMLIVKVGGELQSLLDVWRKGGSGWQGGTVKVMDYPSGAGRPWYSMEFYLQNCPGWPEGWFVSLQAYINLDDDLAFPENCIQSIVPDPFHPCSLRLEDVAVPRDQIASIARCNDGKLVLTLKDGKKMKIGGH